MNSKQFNKGPVGMELNKVGEWTIAIPMPLYHLKYVCPDLNCNRQFWTMRGYRGHYALVHVLMLRQN